MTASEEHEFLKHPDAREIFESSLGSLLAESDRGAVIIGLDLIDAALETLLKSLAPASQSREEAIQLFNYPGPLSSVAGKVSVAFACRLIDRSLFDAISSLRKLRNTVAHSSDKFSLNDHRQSLKSVCNLGPNVPLGINRIACDTLAKQAVGKIKEIRIEGSDIAPFETSESAIEWLCQNQQALDILEEKRPRFELGIAIGIACAVIIFRREQIFDRLEGDMLLAQAIPLKSAD